MGLQLARAEPWKTSVLVTFILIILCDETFAFSGDGCDWVGSGLREDASREVQPIYLRCALGYVEWNYPRGALRVVLRHGTSGKEFRGCLRTDKHFNGAQIYVEGPRKLHLLYSKTDGKHPDLLRCFTSFHGQVALYVEAEPVNNTLHKEVASFRYDLQPVSNEALLNDLDECRPCTEEEILTYYCTSSFVIQGSISSLQNQDAFLWSALTVQVTKVYRDCESPVVSTLKDVNTETVGKKEAVLYRLIKCGTKHGVGDFIFMGRRMLGYPILHCAPKLPEWQKVRRKALLEGTNQCQLD